MPSPPFQVVSIFEYKSDYDDDLSFPVGADITVTAIEDDEWFSGEYNGKSGMFPKNFVSSDTPDTKIDPAPATEPINDTGPDPVNEPSVVLSPQKSTLDPLSSKLDPSSVTLDPTITPKSDPLAHDFASKVLKSTPALAKTFAGSGGAVFPGQKIVDPYTAKKQQFVPLKSSYIPPIKPRDDSNLVHTHFGALNSTPVDVVNEHSVTEEEAKPQMSLKERIALIQKQQQEEAEREAEAVRRREERKQERKKAQEVAAADPKEPKERTADPKDSPKQSIRRRISVDSNSELVTSPVNEDDHREVEILEEYEQDDEFQDANDVDSLVGHSIPPTGSLKSTLTGQSAILNFLNTLNQPLIHPLAVADDPESEEESKDTEPNQRLDAEESDDEELRRRKLVERMAKISGGRNIFGMPFALPKKEKKDKEVFEEPSSEAVPAVPSVPTTPISPVAAPAVPASVSPSASAIPRRMASTSSKHVESSSMGEEDDLTESDTKFAEAGEFQVHKHPEAVKPFEITPPLRGIDNVTSDEEEDTSARGREASDSSKGSDVVKLSGNTPHEADFTGYDADEDLSEPRAVSRQPIKGPGGTDRDLPTIPPTPATPKKAAPPPPPTSAPSMPAHPYLGHVSTPSSPIPPIPSASVRSEAPPLPSARPPVPVGPTLNSAPPIPSVPAPTEAESPTSTSMPPPLPSGPPPVSGSAPPIPLTRAPGTFELSNFEPQHSGTRSIPENSVDLYEEEDDDDDDDDDEFASVTGSKQAAPHAPLSNTDTGTSISSATRRSTDRNLTRATTDLKGSELLAHQALLGIDLELANYLWWIKGDLPESLTSRIGVDVLYEVESLTHLKRGGRALQSKDFYVLFADLSQIVFEILYDAEDPRETVKAQVFARAPPIPRKDLLEKNYHQFGTTIINAALEAAKQGRVAEDLVNHIFETIPQVLPPVGTKGYGVAVYKNNSNHNVLKLDDIKPGDILAIKQGKFVHKGFSNKSVVVGEGEHLYVAVVYEYDSKKDKFKVISLDKNGNIKKESFKIGEMKLGRVRVFRAVDRSYVGW